MSFNYKRIEDFLEYNFKNKKLLKQAFTRKSYSEENGGLDNEILEFIGDKVLDYIVVRMLSSIYGKVKTNGYLSEMNEGELTEIKANLVKSSNLASIIKRSNLDKQLIVGNSDKDITQSMREDLFESLVGAVALDSNWDQKILLTLIDKLLGIREYFGLLAETDNYVGELQKLLNKNGYDSPEYFYVKDSDKDCWICCGVIEELNIKKYVAGNSKKEARRLVAKLILAQLENENFNSFKNAFEKVIGEPNMENSLQQINQLVQAKLISKPTFETDCDYDSNGNPIWKCKCISPEVKEYYFRNVKGYTNSKKVAERNAAYNLLKYLVDECK